MMATYRVTFKDVVEVETESAARAILRAVEENPEHTRLCVDRVEEVIEQPPIIHVIEPGVWDEL